jgi:hypothetical protein
MTVARRVHIWLLVICLLAFVAAAQSENPSSQTFTGVITDKGEGVPISKAHVWIHEDNGGRVFSAIPDGTGHFSLHLPDGYYDVLFSASGFAPFCKKIWVHDGKVVTVEVRLGPDLDTSQVD